MARKLRRTDFIETKASCQGQGQASIFEAKAKVEARPV